MPRAFSSGAASIWSYALNSPPKRSAPIFVSAAVSVVLPWSTWPIVPTFTCGFLRSNFSLDMAACLADCVVVATAFVESAAADRRSSVLAVMDDRTSKWCSRMESNHRPPPYQGGALPTELREQLLLQSSMTAKNGTASMLRFSIEARHRTAVRWSGRRESNPHHQLGRLRFYH